MSNQSLDLDKILMQAIIGDNPISYNEDGKRRADRAKAAIEAYIEQRIKEALDENQK